MRLISQSLLICLISLFVTVPVFAVPGLPSSFYGEVKVNNKNVPDGTVIQAFIDGQAYAEGQTLTYQGASVYTLDVPADDLETTSLEGGVEGDLVYFEIGGVLAEQTGVWHAGTNENLDLSTTTTDQIAEPQATHSPVPTQTPISRAQPTNTGSASGQILPTATALAQPAQSETETVDASSAVNTSAPVLKKSTEVVETSPTHTQLVPASSITEPLAGSESESSLPIFLIVVVVAIASGGVTWFIRKKI
jgi:hypothetical protein